MTDPTPKTIEDVLAVVQRLQKTSTSERVWAYVFKAGTVIVIPVCFWMITLEKRVTVIESNRFTNQMASEMEARLSSKFPPDWLKEDVTEIKDRLRRLEEKK